MGGVRRVNNNDDDDYDNDVCCGILTGNLSTAQDPDELDPKR